MTENKLFHYLLYKFVPNIHTYEHHKRSKTEFIFNPNEIANKDFINCHFVDSFLHEKKFQNLKQFLNNSFLTAEKKENFLHYFQITQRCYYKFKKLYHIYKIKKSKIYDNEHDLCFLPLNQSKNNYNIIQKDTIYVFKVNDLIRIILEGLTYTYDMFLEPKTVKNPYNNVELSEHELYNICIYIINNTNIILPQLLFSYFKCEFNMAKFVLKNEAYLKDLAIQKFVTELDENDEDDRDKLYENIMNMIEKTNIINIADTYPRDDIIEKLKHCLPDFLFSEYSYNPSKRRIHKRKLVSKLKEFRTSNPTYGRTFHRINRNRIIARRNEERNMGIEPPYITPEPNIIPDVASDNNTVNNYSDLDTETVNSDDNNSNSSEDNNSSSSEEILNTDNDVIVNNNNITWINNILDENNTTIMQRAFTYSYNRTLLYDDDNLLANTPTMQSYTFNNSVPSLNTVTINNVTSNNILTSPTSSLDITELDNQPYDASIGPFSPVPSNSSLSPTSRNLNILNTTEFNINIHNNNNNNNDNNNDNDNNELTL